MSDDSRLGDLFSPERLRRSWRDPDEGVAAPAPSTPAGAEEEPWAGEGWAGLSVRQLGERLRQLVPADPVLVELVERLRAVVERIAALEAGVDEQGDEQGRPAERRPIEGEGAAAEALMVAEVAEPSALAGRVGELLEQIEDLIDARRLGRPRAG